MRNSDLFLDAFASVERYLRLRVAADTHMPFSRMLRQVASDDSLLACFSDDLREFADLRNAIVHERGGGRAIAEPHDEVVLALERIAKLLAEPPQALSVATREVNSVKPNSPLSEVLKLVLEFTISQLPVLDEGRIVGLITTNTISRWLGARGASASLEESTADALQYSETRENYTILSKTESVAAVISAFSRRQKEGVPLEAILITEDGSPTRTLLGIVTATDLPEAHRMLRIPSALLT